MLNLVNLLPEEDPPENGDDDNDNDGLIYPPFMCIICMRTARNPSVSFCGHHFCTRCIYTWIDARRGNAKCPICQACIGPNTLIAVRYNGGPVYPTCSSLAEQRWKFLMEKAALPRASMFTKGFVRQVSEPFPRIQPLPPQLMREAPQERPIRYFIDHSVFRRFAIMAIMIVLYLMFIHSTGPNWN